MSRQNAVKEVHGKENLNWQDELQVANEYVAYRQKFFEMLAQFDYMYDDLLWSIKALQH